MRLSAKLSFTIIAAAALICTNTAFAKHRCCHHKKMEESSAITYKQGAFVPLWTPFWYAEGNLGVAVTHDKPTTTGHVDNTGPGWNVSAGYQFTPMWGLEAGYTQYHDSHDDLAGVNIAHTEHYSTDVAATGQYPITRSGNLNILGKLGAAFSYARKDTPGGTMHDAGSFSPYYALGFEYNLTKTVDVIAQWARARGNRQTGSGDLYSLGLKVALV